MTIIAHELAQELNGSVKRKRNSTKKLKHKAARVSEHASEVMVKITGFAKGAAHVKAHLTYISRHGEIEIENDRGEVFKGKDEVKDFFKDWEGDINSGRRHKNQRDTMHVVLSMPENTDPAAVKNGVREFAKETFGKNHEYVFALHTDVDHPHCHLTVKCKGFDGRSLQVAKGDPQVWRETFAEKMQLQGVDAEATARRSRGVIRKAENQIVRHIEKGDKTHAPRVPKVKALKEREIINELIQENRGAEAKKHPWEIAIETKQQTIRDAWLDTANALEAAAGKVITFNKMEQKNERPDYERISTEQIRASQRHVIAQYIHKPDPNGLGRPTPAQSIARVRDVSGLDVVQHSGANQMLLRANARDRLGWGRSTGSDVRRSGVGNNADTGAGSKIDNKTLADKIRAFVATMPKVETERDKIRRDLVQKFSKQQELKSQETQKPATKKSAIEIAPIRRDTDIDR